MNKLQTAIHVYKKLKHIKVNTRQVSGTLPESAFRQCKTYLENQDLLISSNDAKHHIEFCLPSERDAIFALDMEDLLQAPSRLIDPPDLFYLADIDYLHNKREDPPDIVSNYFDTCLFAKTLTNLSDHYIKSNLKAIFLHGEKLELSLKYKIHDLKPLTGLKEFIDNFINAEIHKEQKTTITKSVLIEMLKSNEINRLSLSCLLNRFTEFLERVNSNYQLYVSEFSFEKIKSQIEREKLDFTIKLNKAFSEIQNQLLAIPVALILIGSQMQPSKIFTLKNISIWASSMVFGIFMSLLIRNQTSTLKAIKLEIDSQWLRMKSKHLFVAEKLGKHYLQLKKRYFLQRTFLSIISIIIAASIAGSTSLLLYSSNSLSLYFDVLYFGSYGGAIYLLICLAPEVARWIWPKIRSFFF